MNYGIDDDYAVNVNGIKVDVENGHMWSDGCLWHKNSTPVDGLH